MPRHQPGPPALRLLAEPASSSRSNGCSPGAQELSEVRLGRGVQMAAHPLDLLGVLRSGERAAQKREAQVDQPGVEHVRLAIAPDRGHLAALPCVPDLSAIETELAGKPEQ